MKMQFVFSFLLLVIFSTVCIAEDQAQYLQDISVTINASPSQGSGVIITRELRLKNNENGTAKTNFVLTAGHVVDHLRRVRNVVDPGSGTEKKVVEFAPVQIVKELNEGGRKVGETRMEGKVIKYSDADTGHDLALLMLHKRNFVDVNTKFYLDNEIPSIGTQLFHVGSLLGQGGSNSMTTGIVSQIGRVLNLSGTNEVIFDQTTVTAFPGSSGGGVFLAKDGRYVGMLVRGAGETFNLTVPIRRMKDFAVKSNLMWVLDETIVTPSLEDILQMPIDDVKTKSNSGEKAGNKAYISREFPFLIKIDVEEFR
jgi:S1-C subfamily serine protease